jgi:membrane fusion protein
MKSVRPSLFHRVFGGRHSGPSWGSFDEGSGGEENDGLLLRKEALSEAEDKGFGRPVAALPVSRTFLSAFLVLMVAAGLALLIGSSYTRKETVRGILRSPQGEVQVSTLDRGVIQTINVVEGQFVHAGDVLFVISTDRTGVTGGIPQADMLRSLAEQEESVRGRLAAIASDDVLNDGTAGAQLQALQSALKAAQADETSATLQREIAEDEYQRALPSMERGFMSRSDLRRREMAAIQARQAVADARGQVASLTAQIAAHRSAAARRPHDSVKERGVLEDTLAEIRQRRAQYLMSRGYVLKAPVSGRVTTLQASVGQTADPMRPLLFIVPDHSKMTAILYVASSGIGLLHPGQRVRIRYDAFPFQTFGAAEATIQYVSQTVLRPEEVETAVRLQEPSYKVVAVLDRQDVDGFGKKFPLVPGMALTADIILEKRSLAAWLFEPLLAAGRQL